MPDRSGTAGKILPDYPAICGHNRPKPYILVSCLQVDRLEDELVGEQEKFKAITEELDSTFAEMSGY